MNLAGTDSNNGVGMDSSNGLGTETSTGTGAGHSEGTSANTSTGAHAEHSTGGGATSTGAGGNSGTGAGGNSSTHAGTDRSGNDRDVFSRPAPCASFADLGEDEDEADISDSTGIIEEIVQDDYVYAFRMPIEEKREGKDMDLPIRYTVVKGQYFFELRNLLLWLKYDKVLAPDHVHFDTVTLTLCMVHYACQLMYSIELYVIIPASKCKSIVLQSK